MLEVDEQNIHLVHLPRFRIGKWWWWWPVVVVVVVEMLTLSFFLFVVFCDLFGGCLLFPGTLRLKTTRSKV